MIAHRLSTVRSASQILVVSGGEIVERGTHDELLRLRSLYCLLHEMQDGGRDGERRRSRARPLRARPLRVRAADRRRR